MDSMPILFVSHGSPMQAVADDAVTQAWQAAAQHLPKPRAILVISAHWETEVPLLSGSARPETIHDFGGFPDELYRLQYPAPGSRTLAETAQGLLRDAGFAAGIDGLRGLDHGAWVPLRHMFPTADIPVVQLSVQSRLCAHHHLALGHALAALPAQGVLILASGHMTHNLRAFFHGDAGSREAAHTFRDWTHERIVARDLDTLVDWESRAPHARAAHPTPEHFLPLFVALGAAGKNYTATPFVSGYTGDVLAMDAYRFEPTTE